ncbi:MAG: CoA transferase subunit A [Eubacterium sp.]|nr:CoA transferase subunit A [Eubacterium sp.]
MAINKVITADEAVAGVQDGMTIAIGGFLGTGTPECIIDALVRKGVKHLTVIANDDGFAEGQPAFGAGKTSRGIGKLLDAHMIDHVIMSHVGVNPRLNEQFDEGTLTYTLVPQGTLAEKLRAGAFGLGGVLTPTGLGTPMETNLDELGREKITIEIDGKKFLLERPLRADYAFLRASVADRFGNFMSAKATKNFNYPMAGCADHTIIATEKLVEIGELDPDYFDIAGVLVESVVEGEPVWQI